MHDIRAIRDDPAAFDAALARRGMAAEAADLIALDDARRGAATAAQAAQARRNEASKAIGQAKAARDEEGAAALMAEVGTLKTRLPALEEAERVAAAKLDGALLALPNLPAADVPDGADEHDNIEQKSWGERPTFAFAARDHADLGPALGLDFEGGARIAGARFTLLRGPAARLYRALGQFMLDSHAANGHEIVAPPLLVREEAMVGTGQLPKFRDESFVTSRWALADPDLGGQPHQSGARADRGGGHAAAPPHRAHPLLPLGSGRGGARHARADPPAPVR